MIIGFVGRLGSGKDTAAARLAQIVDMPTERVAFADKLKESAGAVLGVSPEDLNEWKNDPEALIYVTVGTRPSGVLCDEMLDPIIHPFTEPNVVKTWTVREYLQRYGTEGHRDVFGTDFWVDQALGAEGVVRPMILEHWPLMLVTDVRFPNEVEGIHRRNGYVVEIKGANDPVLAKSMGEWYDQATHLKVHPSEYPLEGNDYTIDNTILDDDFAHLDSQLYDLATKLGLPLKEA